MRSIINFFAVFGVLSQVSAVNLRAKPHRDIAPFSTPSVSATPYPTIQSGGLLTFSNYADTSCDGDVIEAMSVVEGQCIQMYNDFSAVQGSVMMTCSNCKI